jgi:hypothetical protein
MNISNFRHFRILPPNTNTAVIVQRVDDTMLTLQREGEDRKDKIDQESLHQLLGNGWRVINVYALVSAPKTETININIDVDSILPEIEDRIAKAFADAVANAETRTAGGKISGVAETCVVKASAAHPGAEQVNSTIAYGESALYALNLSNGQITGMCIGADGVVEAMLMVTGPDVQMLDAVRKIVRQGGETWERKVPGERWYRSDRQTHVLHSTEHMSGLLRNEAVRLSMFTKAEYRAYLERVIETAQERKEELIEERREALAAAERHREDVIECNTRIATTRAVIEGLGQ